ncbi:MAG: methylenetetrahydrofolate reductase [NAD(P)H] [Zetaproteobacteria bacterium CG1_02_53_45]|nr:MAG: methylenetetrahydrofolate reductase [NAD(P)H] [Zetaproteobacteria bacterium CG1_02_53_45]
MKLSHILNTASKPLFSCEFFPPRTDKGEENLWSCLKELQTINPAYISVTYGAGGTTQDRTKGIVTRIKDETGLSPVAHLTCVGANKDELAALLADYRGAGIENILALRGDAPEGMDRFEAATGGFSYATDLISFLREQGDFSIACATYPEGHPESKGGVADDIRYLKMKQDNGADCAITQYFFENETFFRFRDACDKAGITLPIIPGIMPVGNFEQIVRFSSMCGAEIPAWMHEKMTPIQHDPDAVKALGIELAARQCRELLQSDAPGLHMYTLNKAEATIAIHRQIKDLL